MDILIDAPWSGSSVAAPARRRMPALPADEPRKVTAPLSFRSRWYMRASFLAADVVALAAVAGVSVVLAVLLLPEVQVGLALQFVPGLALLLPAYALGGMYAGAVMHPAEEMRRMAIIASVACVSLGGAFFLSQGFALAYVLLVGGVGTATVILAPLARAVMRSLCVRASWWGYPVVVLGRGASGVAALRVLKRWPELGLRPVALLDDRFLGQEVEGVPVCGTVTDAPLMALDHGIPYAIVAMPNLPHRQLMDTIGRLAKFYDRVLVVPDAAVTPSVLTTSRYFDGVIGYDVQHRRRKRVSGIIKRMFDLVVACVVILATLPVWLVLAIVVRLDSAGPILFKQTRIGYGGHAIKVFKFRSMYMDAGRRLEEILEADEALRTEYETFRKLKEDPRVTRVGRLMRRYSLDELPQLFNVLRGDMSLVGPRAYTPNELGGMSGMEKVIMQSPPGVTGLWQVSGRNNLSFEERVTIDVHYTYNWNFWLDAFILVRTVPVVLTGDGAC